MPTQPRPAPHQARELAEGFGADPAHYDRARPRYPHALITLITEGARGGAGDVLDVGCGTGILALQLLAVGARVVGVEVDDRMAGFARARGVQVETAKLEDWDGRGRTFDAVVAGQTWHWIDPAAGATRAADVLRPGGRLVLAWNVFLPSAEVMNGFAAVYGRVLPDLPYNAWAGDPARAYETVLDTATEGIGADGRYESPERWTFDRPHTYAKDEWLDQVPTAGGHNRLPARTLSDLLTGLAEVIDSEGGGELHGRLVTKALAVRRRP